MGRGGARQGGCGALLDSSLVRRRLTVLLALPALALAACSSSGSSSPTSAATPPTLASAPASVTGSPSAAAAETATAPSSSSAECAPGQLKTRTSGTLTVATDKPAYGPWFADDDPTNGKGFESAVAYAVAEKLGYPKDKVTWTVASFNSVIAPGPKSFDVDLNEVSITPARAKAVDFSSGYYDVAQTVIALKKNGIAKATTLAGLKDAKLGAQVGTTSYKAITEQIKPGPQPQVYDSNDLAKKALENGQIDGLVVDLPTAFFITSAELADATIVGQLAQSGGTAEQFGMVLDKGSPLTSCVTQAVDALRADGTLEKLQQQWLAQGGAPVLTP